MYNWDAPARYIRGMEGILLYPPADIDLAELCLWLPWQISTKWKLITLCRLQIDCPDAMVTPRMTNEQIWYMDNRRTFEKILATQIPEGHIVHTCISHQQYCVPKVEATLWEYDSCPGGQSLWWETPSMPASQLCKTLFPGKSPDHSVHTYWWPNQPCCVLCIPLWLVAAWCSIKSWS